MKSAVFLLLLGLAVAARALRLPLGAARAQRTAALRMVAVEEPKAIQVKNPFQSPSLIQLSTVKNNEGYNPLDSPSIIVNGGRGKESGGINLSSSPSIIMLARPGTETYNALGSPCVEFLGIDATKQKNVMTSPCLQFTSESKTKDDLPLSLIVGQDLIKSALIYLAVNPKIGGLVIAGAKGSGKSVLARALHRIMPPIERVKGSEYNIAPDAEDENQVDDFLLKRLAKEGKTLRELETEVVSCPFVQVPVNVMEDRLFGSVDAKKTLEQGETVFTPGLLAAAHRGILYVDDIGLLDTELLTLLLKALSDGYVMVEREGVSVRYPCQPLLIATYNPEDCELKDNFLDRIGIALSTDTEPLTLEERVEAVQTVLSFTDAERQPSAADAWRAAYEKEEQLRSAIVFAREYIRGIDLTIDQVRYLCEEAVRGGCQGHRAELAAARVALAAAALEDAGKVRADDLRTAVRLAIVPRSKFRTNEAPDEEMMPPPPPPPAPKPNSNMDESTKDKDEEERDEEEKEDDKEDEDEEEDDDEEAQGEPSIPQEFMFDAVGVPLEDDMLKFGGRQKSGKGGKGALVFSRERGRYVRPVLPRNGEPIRVALDATLREAAKQQTQRRRVAASEGKDPNRIYLEPSDLRAKLMARKAGSLLIFAVDASGSMALNRMNAAKGAACGLLTEAYQSRDKIALIPFQGQRADVLLPPTRSISMAKNRLDMMPCGGGSPLAHALTQAVRTALNAMSSGDVGRCVVVLISDGRANVPLDVSLGTAPPVDETKKLTDAEKKELRNKLKEEVIGIAKQISAMPNIKLLVIDTENKFVSTGMAKEIATAAGGRYHYIPKASADAMKKVTVEAVASLKQEQRSR